MITGEYVSLVRGLGSELYRIREHTPEDPARFVDWKASAKTGSLKVREFSREDEKRLRIVFDNSLPGGVPADAYEHAVSVAASLAFRFTNEGVDVTYAAPQYHGSPHLYDFLAYLAVVEPQDSESILESLSLGSEYNVIITARKPGNIPAGLWDCSHVIQMSE